MAKRFTDTEIWDKEWFMALSPKLKCLVKMVRDKCDLSGVWSPNWIIANTYIGETVCEKELLGIDEGRQFLKLASGKIFCLGFVKFQYGELSEKSPVHRKIISLLKNHGLNLDTLSTPCFYPINRVKEKEEEEEEEKEKEEDTEEKEKGGLGEKEKTESANQSKENKPSDLSGNRANFDELGVDKGNIPPPVLKSPVTHLNASKNEKPKITTERNTDTKTAKPDSEKKYPLWKEYTDAYKTFMEEVIGQVMPANAWNNNGLPQIIDWLVAQSKGDRQIAIDTFRHILSRPIWKSLSPYHQSKFKLPALASELPNIVYTIKNNQNGHQSPKGGREPITTEGINEAINRMYGK